MSREKLETMGVDGLIGDKPVQDRTLGGLGRQIVSGMILSEQVTYSVHWWHPEDGLKVDNFNTDQAAAVKRAEALNQPGSEASPEHRIDVVKNTEYKVLRCDPQPGVSFGPRSWRGN